MSDRTRTDYIVVHCSATPPNMDIGAQDIDRWHREKGWSGIGYHYVIRRDGTLEYGRRKEAKGAHARGHNQDSISVCLVGGVNQYGDPEPNFTDAQFAALRETLAELEDDYPGAEILGHRDFGIPKACPSFNVQAWWLDNEVKL